MDKIVVLDQNMINLIAAGEVIERPASVVKELMENSIDAGACRIIVKVEDGGRKLISVTDDGAGMSSADMERAFQPHATSKLATPEDLQKIGTLGFRGEALASISSIAKVDAVTRMKDSEAGHSVEIDYGKMGEVAPANCDYGTTIEIRNLFYKTPARRKFLRSPNTELNHIKKCFTRIALANCQLELILMSNGREVYRLDRNQPLRMRIRDLFSERISENLLETESREKDTRIRAFLGLPDIAAGNSKYQYIFLNGRFIRDKSLSHAVREAYRGSIEPGRYPVVFIFMEMPSDKFDVNVHPTKIEVRFYNPNLIYSQVLGTLREKILSSDMDVKGRFIETEDTVKKKEFDNEIKNAIDGFLKKQRASTSQPRFEFKNEVKGTGKRQIGKQRRSSQINRRTSSDITEGKEAHEQGKNFLQVHDSFIIVESDEGFSIVDQHALHERVIYQKLKDNVHEGRLESQKLLIPESFNVSDFEEELIEENREIFEKLGIELDSFGPGSLAVQSFPVLLSKASPAEVVKELLEMLEDSDRNYDHEKLLDEVLHMAACKAAIKAGQHLSRSEVEELLEMKMSTDFSSRCPHGRPTVLNFSLDDLRKQFKRT